MPLLKEMSDFTVDPKTLLDLVKQHRCLYDKTCLDFKSLDKKAASWAEVAAEINCDNPALLKKKYLSIRTTLGRYFKKQDILGNFIN